MPAPTAPSSSSSSSCKSPHPNITVRRRRLPDEKENSNQPKDISSSSSSADFDTVLQQFQQAAQQTCQASFWETKSKLAATVVKASLRGNDHDESPINISKSDEAALFSSTRKVIKEATEAKDTNTSFLDSCLCVALHTLRSLACREPDRVEGVIKCLYHVVITAADSAMDSGDDANVSRIALYSIMAYETLGRTFLGYTCPCGDKKILAFEMPTECIYDVLQDLFPVPLVRKPIKGLAVGSLSLEQLSTLGIRASFAVARILLKLVSNRSKIANDDDEEYRQSLWIRMKKAKLHRSFESVVHILQKVLPQWISLSALETKVNIKEVQHHCKTSYQMLVQAATASKDNDHALDLRKEAVLALLGVNLDANLQPRLAEKFFEQACINAHKFAAIYFQEAKLPCPVSATHAVALFHNSAGAALDDAVAGNLSPASLSSYMDYCAIRALHAGVRNAETTCCASRTCVFRWLRGGRYVHDNCENNVDAATMALYFTSLQILDKVEATNTQKSTTTDYRRVIDHFLSLRNGCSHRHFKLLCSTSLHRRIHDYLSKETIKSHRDDVRSRQLALEAAAIILGKCLPSLATAGVKSDKLEQAFDSMYWCFRGALGVLELLYSVFEKQSYLQQSDDLVHDVICEQLLRQKEPKVLANCIESLAKYLSSLGRRRHEQKQCPLVPLLYSLKLFHLLPANRMRDIQISSRWTFLASIYRANDQLREAYLASAYALLHADFEFPVDLPLSSDYAEQCFCRMAVAAGWTQEHSETSDSLLGTQKSGLVARLVNAYDEVTGVESPMTTKPRPCIDFLAVNDTVGMLLNDMSNGSASDRQEVAVPTVVDLLRHITFRRPFADFELEPGAALCRLDIILEALSCTSRVLQQRVQRDGCSSSLTLYAELSAVGTDFVQEIMQHDLALSAVLTSMVHVVSATFVLACHSQVLKFDRWSFRDSPVSAEGCWAAMSNFASNALSMALEPLKDVGSGADDWSVMAISIMPAIVLMQTQIGSKTTYGQELDLCEGLIGPIRDIAQLLSDDLATSPMIPLARSIAAASFSRACDFLKSEGEKLFAYEVSSLGRQVAGHQEDMLSLWFEATANLLEREDTVLRCQETKGLAVIRGDVDDVVQLEFFAIASRIRHSALFKMFDDYSQSCIDSLLTSWDEIKGLIEKHADVMAQTLFWWYRCTIECGLSEIAGRLGVAATELYFAKQCLRSCQNATSNLICFHKLPRKKSGSKHADWKGVITKTMDIRLRQLEIECRQQISDAYLKTGNWKKALQYNLSALQLGRYEWSGEADNIVKLSWTLATSRSKTCQNSQDLQLRKALIRIIAHATAPDLVLDEYKRDMTIVGSLSKGVSCSVGLNWELGRVLCETEVLRMLSEDAWFPDSAELLEDVYSSVKNGFDSFLIKQSTWNFARTLDLGDRLPETVAPVVQLTLWLYQARNLSRAEDTHEQASQLCASIVDCSVTPHLIRAEALYILGSIHLMKARIRGELHWLWEDILDRNTEDASACDLKLTVSARHHYQSAMRFLGSASNSLARRILRCLALVTGPDCTAMAESACNSIHTSIGRELRLRLSENVGDKATFGLAKADEVEWALRVLDDGWGFAEASKDSVNDFFASLTTLLPCDWRIVGMTLCPTGELLVTSLSIAPDGKLCRDTTCVFPKLNEHDEARFYEDSLYASIISPLDELVERNNEHLQGSANDELNGDQSKRGWWDQRSELDQRLQNHIERVEAEFFESDSVSRVLFGKQTYGNLFSRFEAALSDDDVGGESNTSCLDPTILLILDENLHRFPFEGMSCFDGRAVCRPPSLPFVLAKLYEAATCSDPDCVDPRRTSYILDPESNLGGTRERMAPFLESLSYQYGSEWKFMIGKPPSKEFMQEQLTVKNGLLLFVGHGAGREYFSRRNIESMIQSDSGKIKRGVKSSLILMGCSSGRLESVNRWNTAHVGPKQVPMYIEPESIAQTYISAGAPCVVANLWDVTDKDIDRFSMDLLSRFLTEPGASLPQCVADARAACKMRYIVGCAPVCYGVPVIRK